MAEEFRTLMQHLERLYNSPLPREELIPADKASWLAEENLKTLRDTTAPPNILKRAEKKLVKLASKAPPAILIHEAPPVPFVKPRVISRKDHRCGIITKFNWKPRIHYMHIEYYIDKNILHCRPHAHADSHILIDLNVESELNKLDTMAIAMRDMAQWLYNNLYSL